MARDAALKTRTLARFIGFEFMSEQHEPIAAIEGNFGPNFDYSPKPVSKHPFICKCPHCDTKHKRRILARIDTKNRWGI